MSWFLFFLLVEPMSGEVNSLTSLTHFQSSPTISNISTPFHQPPPPPNYLPNNSSSDLRQSYEISQLDLTNSNFPPPCTYQTLQPSYQFAMHRTSTSQPSHHSPHSSPSAVHTNSTSQPSHQLSYSSLSAMHTNSTSQPSHHSPNSSPSTAAHTHSISQSDGFHYEQNSFERMQDDEDYSDSEDVFGMRDEIDTDKFSSVHNQLPSAWIKNISSWWCHSILISFAYFVL